MSFIFNGKRISRVGLYGFGRSNRAVMSYLERRYGDLSFVLRADRPVELSDAEAAPFCECRFSDAAMTDFREDLLILSPAIRPDREEFLSARSRGVLFSADADLFFKEFRGRIFAVSGSDGKSTTTTLASLLLSSGKQRIPAIGNIGAPMTPWLDRDIPYAAVELSSFQLFSSDLGAYRALITNVTPNHLDWHSSLDEYIHTKEKLFALAKERVVNLDCPFSRQLLVKYGAAASYSIYLNSREQRALCDCDTVSLEDGFICVNGEEILHTGAVKCNSRHNIHNLLGAIALTLGYSSKERICEVASEFAGLPHRCELVGCFGGIRYINSSIDSTPQRTITTLGGFEQGVTVILGGRSKGLDYLPLARLLCERGDRAVLTGETGRLLADMLSELGGCDGEYFPRFEDAVRFAATTAKSGDTVILSPASTSFDSFSSYEERGNRFKDIIRNIYYGS